MQHRLDAPTVRWPYPPLAAGQWNTDPVRAQQRPDEVFPADVPELPTAGEQPCTGVRVVINGRVVVHRNFLQDAVQSMVRCALAEERAAFAD